MDELKVISGATSDEIWQQVAIDLADQEIYEYNVILKQAAREVELLIDIDMGGGFEAGYQFTSFKSYVEPEHDFRFALHHKDLIDAAGKFFGLEDVVIGYPEFDDALIVKTNNQERTHRIFFDMKVRGVFQSLHAFNLHLTHYHVEESEQKLPFLELTIEEGITDPAVLKELYEAFYTVLIGIDG